MMSVEETSETEQEDATEQIVWTFRPTKIDRKRMQNLKEKLGTDNASEVMRRAMAFMDVALDAEALWAEENGEKHRIWLK